MSFTIDQLSKAFSSAENKGSPQNTFGNFYRFWGADSGVASIVRFIPDPDAENPLLWTVPKHTHRLRIGTSTVNVPCLKHDYGEECPICKKSAEYYKKEGKETIMGKALYRGRSNIAQVLVIDDPLEADAETGENSNGKVMAINLGYQLFSVIAETVKSGELENPFMNLDTGTHFQIKSNSDGRWKNYSMGSKFLRKETPLTDAEIAVINETAVPLSKFLPEKPDLEWVELMLTAFIEQDEDAVAQ